MLIDCMCFRRASQRSWDYAESSSAITSDFVPFNKWEGQQGADIWYSYWSSLLRFTCGFSRLDNCKICLPEFPDAILWHCKESEGKWFSAGSRNMLIWDWLNSSCWIPQGCTHDAWETIIRWLHTVCNSINGWHGSSTDPNRVTEWFRLRREKCNEPIKTFALAELDPPAPIWDHKFWYWRDNKGFREWTDGERP